MENFSLFYILIFPAATPILLHLLPFEKRSKLHSPIFFITSAYLTGIYLVSTHLTSSSPIHLNYDWVPALGLNFSLAIKPFTAWFSILILLLGFCINLFTLGYVSENQKRSSLLITLGFFTSAMIGVVLSDNFFLLFLFWETTSITSFLLVGFYHQKETARNNASQALLVTLAGGGALLAGLIITYLSTGTTSITSLLAMAHADIPTVAIILIIIGALSKSAQWPFHFWLPNAMVGPAPISAFLHSATMVKAGVFILATFAPIFRENPFWTPILVSAGFLTVIAAVRRGIWANNIKAILATTTLCALGNLTMLTAIGTPLSLLAFCLFLSAHALYKAPLFLLAGIIEKKHGTLDLDKLKGVAKKSPSLLAVVGIASASLIGLFPFIGFLAKEYFLKSAWEISPPIFTLFAISLVGPVLLGLKIIIPLISKNTHDDQPVKQTSLLLTVSTLIPIAGILVLSLFHNLFNQILMTAGADLANHTVPSIKFWHGWTPPLITSLCLILISTALYFFLPRKPKTHNDNHLSDTFYSAIISSLLRTSRLVAHLQIRPHLSLQITTIILAIGLISLVSVDPTSWPSLTASLPKDNSIFLVLTPLLIISSIFAAAAKQTVSILVSLGFVGLLIALIFLWFSAPDLALTQLMAETLLLFLLAGALFKTNSKAHLSKSQPNQSPLRLPLSVFATILTTTLILKAMSLEWDHPISAYHLENSKPLAYGANVVNVILVDFRALDTLGEIIVLLIAALGANAALGASRSIAPLPKTTISPLFAPASKILSIFFLMIASWIFLRGHNSPGGGFIAALLVATSAGIPLVMSPTPPNPKRLRKLSDLALKVGITLAIVAALLPLATQKPLLSGLWLHWGNIHLGTPLIFDLGIFLVVIGFALNFLRHLHHSNSNL